MALFLTFYLTFYLASILAIILASILTVYLAFCLAFCNFPLIFAVWPQPSRFPQGRNPDLRFLCGVVRRVCGVLRLVCVHVSVLKVSVCYGETVEGEELKQIRSKIPEVQCSCS